MPDVERSTHALLLPHPLPQPLSRPTGRERGAKSTFDCVAPASLLLAWHPRRRMQHNSRQWCLGRCDELKCGCSLPLSSPLGRRGGWGVWRGKTDPQRWKGGWGDRGGTNHPTGMTRRHWYRGKKVSRWCPSRSDEIKCGCSLPPSSPLGRRGGWGVWRGKTDPQRRKGGRGDRGGKNHPTGTREELHERSFIKLKPTEHAGRPACKKHPSAPAPRCRAASPKTP